MERLEPRVLLSAAILAVSGVVVYTENDPATAIDTGLTVTDIDSTTPASATVTITNDVAGQDVLGFVNDGATMGNVAVTTNIAGVLTLTSAGQTATNAEWQSALRAVTYFNSSDNPDTTTRTVDFVINDGSADSNAVTSSISLIATADAPVLAVSGVVVYTENDPATAIDTGLTVSDVDSTTQASATVTITNDVAGQDVLGFVNDGATMGNVAVTTNIAGVLTLTSAGQTATNAEWQSALRAVTYFNSSDNPNTTTRTVDFVINDGSVNSNAVTSSISLIATADAPVLAVSGFVVYTENDPATAIDTGLTVTDIDSTTQASATVTITNYVAGQDVLGFVNDGATMGNVAVTTNIAGVLTLTSAGQTATNAEWQSALRAVTYFNSSDNPDTTTRTVDFVINDGSADSNAVTSSISLIATADAPVLAVSGVVVYTENDPATAIDTGLTVSDVDSTTQASATVTITNYVAGQDVLAFVNDGATMGNVAVTTNIAGVLTLTSAGQTATNAEWQSALRAVTYFNSSDNPDTTTRTVDFVINDGSADSNAVTSSISLIATADAPVLAVSGFVVYTENDPATAIDTGVTVTDVDSTTQASATVTITNYVAGQDVLAFVNDGATMGNVAVTTNIAGVLTLTSAGQTATNAEWQSALRAVTYFNSADNPNTTTRTVDFIINDGSVDSNAVTSTVAIVATNDAPVLFGIEGTPHPYAPNAAATTVTSTLTLTDADNGNMTGATIQITSHYQLGMDVLGFTNTAGITGVWNAATGTLTLTGSDTIANYQAALRSVTYASSSQDPAARTIGFQVTDGTDLSNVASRSIGGELQLVGTTLNVYGTVGVDVITVTESDNLVINRDGINFIYSPAAVTAINIYANDGNDTIQINSLNNGTALQAYGENGNDTIRVASTVTAGITLDGGVGNDLLIGGSGDDTLSGGIGNDWLNGGDGFDNLYGGVGNDVYAFTDTTVNQLDTIWENSNEGTDLLNFAALTTAVTVDLTSDTSLATMSHRIVRAGSAGQAANFENVNGGSANDFITGNAVNNVIYGNGGNDTLSGGDGNDQLDGGSGNDLLKGGNQDDVLSGGIGDDYLKGDAGNDVLIGGDGFNTLVGGLGNDTYAFSDATVNQIDTVVELVGEGTDSLNFSALTTAVTADLTGDTPLATMNHRIVWTGAAGQAANFENISGGAGNDQLTGNAANNVIFGNGGNDTINGGSGNDILVGGAGNDILKGISGQNILIGGTGADLLLGGTGDDLMLSESLSYENNLVGLDALLAEWALVTPYQARVAHLSGTTPGGANGGYVLNSTTVTKDVGSDYLTGNSGSDWYLASASQDVVTDQAIDEIFTNTDTWV